MVWCLQHNATVPALIENNREHERYDKNFEDYDNDRERLEWFQKFILNG